MKTINAPACGPVQGDALLVAALPDFEGLIGAVGWRRLAPDIRRRFTEKPRPGQPIVYSGVMHIVWCSALGWLLAQLCQLIGTPFAPYRGVDVPVVIRLLDGGAHAVVWEREYRYPQRAPVLVRSTKLSAADGLRECIGYGLGMKLAVYEEQGALHFRSRRYFWRVAGSTLPLPHLLSPGVAHVVHADLGDGSFRFCMTVRHGLFGTLFRQEGVFRRAARTG